MVWFTGKLIKGEALTKFLTVPDLMYFDLYRHDCGRANDRPRQRRLNRGNVHENDHHHESDRESDRGSAHYHRENARAFHHHHGIIQDQINSSKDLYHRLTRIMDK